MRSMFLQTCREISRLKDIRPWFIFAIIFMVTMLSTMMLGLKVSVAANDKVLSTPVPEDEFNRRIRSFILENPEVIIEAMELFDAKQREAKRVEAVAALTTRADEILRDPTSPVDGNPAGDVTMVEFFDYNCHYCRRVLSTVAEAQAADPQLRIVYKEFPVLGPNSVFAAKAALAARRQGKYVVFHKALMRLQGPADEPRVLNAAKNVGLDLDRLKTDIQDPETQKAIDRNTALGLALGINGTPTFIIGNNLIPGATDLKTLQGLINVARDALTIE